MDDLAWYEYQLDKAYLEYLGFDSEKEFYEYIKEYGAI